MREWKEHVRRTALEAWTNAHTLSAVRVAFTLFHLHREVALDVDNIVKPVQDALIGVALDDDSRITDLIVRRRSLVT